jgi:hypothetical protein
MNDLFYQGLEVIIREGDLEKLDTLLHARPDSIDDKKILHQLLCCAVQNSKLPIVRELCDMGADVNRFSFSSEPLLVVAMRDSSDEIVLLLKHYGATVQERYLFSKHDYYPYHYAMQSEQSNLVNLFRLCTKIALRCRDGAKERCDVCNAMHCSECWIKHEICGICGKKSCKMCLPSCMIRCFNGWYCTDFCFLCHRSWVYMVNNLIIMTNVNVMSDCDITCQCCK